MIARIDIPPCLAEWVKKEVLAVFDEYHYMERADGTVELNLPVGSGMIRFTEALIAECIRIVTPVCPSALVIQVAGVARVAWGKDGPPPIMEASSLLAWIKAAEWAMAQKPEPKPEYDVMTHWKFSDGRITKFEELDCNHLYNILNKRVTEPTWRGFVPEDKVGAVFTKLWAVARGHLHKWSKHTAAWFSATRGALAKVPGEGWVEKGYDGMVWVVTDDQAARSHPAKPIIGTIREVRNGLVSLNVLPHMVDWVKRNLEVQPMPAPQQPAPQIVRMEVWKEFKTDLANVYNKLPHPAVWESGVVKPKKYGDGVTIGKVIAVHGEAYDAHGYNLVHGDVEVLPEYLELARKHEVKVKAPMPAPQQPLTVVSGNTHEVHNINMIPGKDGKVYVKGDLCVEGKLHAPFNGAMDDLRAEFNARLNKLEEATKTLATLEKRLTAHDEVLRSHKFDIDRIDRGWDNMSGRLEDVQAAIRDLKHRLDTQTGRLDDHGKRLGELDRAAAFIAGRIATDAALADGNRKAEKMRCRRTLWRLLPWIMTAVLGIGLGIANHYEGWIKLEWQDEAANR